MKRIIALTAMALLVASSAFAADIAGGAAITATNTTTNATAPLGKLSTNVSLSVIYNTTAFAAVTKHKSGNRGFGTSSSDTRIYYNEIGIDKESKDLGLANSDSSDFTTANKWTSL